MESWFTRTAEGYMQIADAEAVNTDVREYFKVQGEGRKSSNKFYAGGDKFIKRKQDQDNAGYLIYQFREIAEKEKYTAEQYARFLQDETEIGKRMRAGNCREMASVAAYLAHHSRNVPKELIYIGKIESPGDHTFCLVSDAPIPSFNRSADTLYGFVLTNRGYVIIDPWLNTVCLSADYIRQTRLKLDKWQVAGKRLFWRGNDGNRRGWYPPAGEYKHAMQRAPLTLYPFT